MALFTATDLTNWLHKPVSSDAATAAESMVWGWLAPVLDLTERPADPSAQLKSWAIELGGIAHTNPEGLAEYQLESERTKYSSERRNEILRTAANGGVTPTGAALTPQGSFPDARCYPDPVEWP